MKWTPNERATTLLRGLMIRSLCFENERCINGLKLFHKCFRYTLWYALSQLLSTIQETRFTICLLLKIVIFILWQLTFFPLEVLHWKFGWKAADESIAKANARRLLWWKNGAKREKTITNHGENTNKSPKWHIRNATLQFDSFYAFEFYSTSPNFHFRYNRVFALMFELMTYSTISIYCSFVCQLSVYSI